MMETSSLPVWKKIAEKCWRDALIGMGKEVRKSCWGPVTELKMVDMPNGCVIIADRRFDMHLTATPSGAHITSNKPKQRWRELSGISIQNVWWLGPNLLLRLFEGCQREKISLFLMEVDKQGPCRHGFALVHAQIRNYDICGSAPNVRFDAQGYKRS